MISALTLANKAIDDSYHNFDNKIMSRAYIFGKEYMIFRIHSFKLKMQ
jgi:hypothetical protein